MLRAPSLLSVIQGGTVSILQARLSGHFISFACERLEAEAQSWPRRHEEMLLQDARKVSFALKRRKKIIR